MIDKTTTKIVLVKNKNGYWSMKIHTRNGGETSLSGDSLKLAIWQLIFRFYAKTWDTQIERLEGVDQTFIIEQCEGWMHTIQNTIKHLLKHFYNKD
jgi:hypothetical protein